MLQIPVHPRRNQPVGLRELEREVAPKPAVRAESDEGADCEEREISDRARVPGDALGVEVVWVRTQSVDDLVVRRRRGPEERHEGMIEDDEVGDVRGEY